MYIRVNKYKLKDFSDTIEKVGSNVGRIENKFSSIGRRLDWDIKECSGIDNTISQITRQMEEQSIILKNMSRFLDLANEKYMKLDSEGKKMLEEVLEPTSDRVENINIPISILNWFVAPVNTFIGSISDEYIDCFRNRKVILENILRYAPDGYTPIGSSSSKANSMSKWSTLVDIGLSGILNGYENFVTETDEYGNKLDFNRALCETGLETFVDVKKGAVIAIGVGKVIKLLITGATAPVLLKGVVIGAGIVAVSSALDWVSEKITGKDFTEFVSDTILDTVGKLDSKINSRKKPSNPPVVNWA